jgi:RNA polymerase sigma-70 factor, ECF subfamily
MSLYPRRTGKPARSRSTERAERAFEELFSEHLDALYRAALRLCSGRESDAQDLMQETALRAFRGFHQLEDPGAVRPWLFTILGRTYLNHARVAKRRSETTFSDLDEGTLEAALEQWQPSQTPDDVLAAHELRARLLQALDSLPAQLRVVIWMVDVEGFRLREVAGALDVPAGTVASRLHRGRCALRESLARGKRTFRRRGGV